MTAASTKMVRYEFDPLNPPPLTEAQKEELRRLAEMPDEMIDFSDAPELTAEQLATARRGLYHPFKEQITARVDADVLAWLKAPGKGYQGRMNAILRKAMLEALKAKG